MRSRPIPVSIEGLGSDVACRRRRRLILHEDEVPDFDVAAAFTGKLAIDVAFFRGYSAHVVENFAARAAGAGIAHGPEIISSSTGKRCAPQEPRARANIFPPPRRASSSKPSSNDAAATVGVAEYRYVELILGNAKPIWRGDQLPRIGDGFLLEVIAEGEIAHHLEKGVVALGEADVFEVVVLAAGADAFLGGGGAVVVALFEAEEDVLELVHAGVGEKQGGIAVGNERRAADAAVAFALEEAEEGLADFVAAPFQFGGVAGHLGLVRSRGNNADIIAEQAGWHQETGRARTV